MYVKMLILLWPFPPCQNSLAVCPQHFVKASVWMIIWGSRCWILLKVSLWLNPPMSHDRCRTLFSLELIFAPFKDIETGFELLKWPGQLMTCQLTLWDLRLKFLVAWKSPDIFEARFNFFSEKASHFLSRNSVCFIGCRTDFLRLIIKPKCCNRKISVSCHEDFW